MRQLVGLLLLAVLAACKSEGKEDLEQAERQHATGQLDAALSTLELLVRQAPDTAEAEHARRTATSWLVEAADRSSSLFERRVRLEQALEWSPASGPAQARLCVVEIEAKDFAAARRCMDEKLPGKTDVPRQLVDRVRNALDAHAQGEADAERKRLLESPSAHHWQALIERFPDSVEAAQAKQRQRRHESLCTDLESYLPAAKKELERQRKLAGRVPEAQGRASKLNERIEAYDEIARAAAAAGREIGVLNGNLDAHELASGEEAAQRALHGALAQLSDSAAALADDLQRHPLENLESYDRSALAALEKWASGTKKTSERIERTLERVKQDCESPEQD